MWIHQKRPCKQADVLAELPPEGFSGRRVSQLYGALLVAAAICAGMHGVAHPTTKVIGLVVQQDQALNAQTTCTFIIGRACSGCSVTS